MQLLASTSSTHNFPTLSTDTQNVNSDTLDTRACSVGALVSSIVTRALSSAELDHALQDEVQALLIERPQWISHKYFDARLYVSFYKAMVSRDEATVCALARNDHRLILMSPREICERYLVCSELTVGGEIMDNDMEMQETQSADSDVQQNSWFIVPATYREMSKLSTKSGLHIAAEIGTISMLSTMFAECLHKRLPVPKLSEQDRCSWRPVVYHQAIFLATENGNVQLLQLLQGLHQRSRSTAHYLRDLRYGNNQVSLMHIAATKNQPFMIRYLAQGCGMELDTPSLDGKVPIHLACKHGGLEACRTLLDLGANIAIRNNINGMTGLHYAAHSGHSAMAELLLTQEGERQEVDHEADDETCSTSSSTSLSSMADVDAFDEQHRTPLMLACMSPHCTSVVSILLDHGASVNISDINNDTPLAVAVENECTETVQLLLKRGADPLEGRPHRRCKTFAMRNLIEKYQKKWQHIP